MQKHRDITIQRLQRFREQLQAKVYCHKQPIQLASYPAPGRIGYAEAMDGEYKPITIGHQFAPVWSTHWVRVEFAIPDAWQGREVHLLWDANCEACVWQDGQPLQGLTGTEVVAWENCVRPEYIVSKNAMAGEQYTFFIEVACNNLFGTGFRAPSDFHQIGLLRQAEIAVFDSEIWDVLWDFCIVSEMAEHLPVDAPRAGQALRVANDMVNACHFDSGSLSRMRAMAAEFLNAKNGDGQHNMSAIGHAHIDTAWLWPLAETVRKCYRTFATALRYIEDYPDYKFVCSQAHQYQWMKQTQPQLYERIREKVREGSFVPAGGTWIEPDCNIPSGESLVRQFLYGQRFFGEEFGIHCEEFWNPDVFGYSGQLPQIMRKSGIRYFLTQKLSWNQFNKVPSHTFLWEGIDGSKVLTHFPPTDTYNAKATVKEALFHVRNYKDHEKSGESYMVFGHGDGGGGPTRGMLERMKRMKDVDGLPQVQMRSPREFFRRLEDDAKDLLTWVGELYFEYHRATYTTQAKNKLMNRRCEILLHDVEFLYAVSASQQYPHQQLRPLWQLVLLNQFHDIIPGSSITEVYKDSDQDYAKIDNDGRALRDAALDALAGEKGDHIFACNTLSQPRCEVVVLPGDFATQQQSAHGQPLAVVTAPAMGYSISQPQQQAQQVAHIEENDEGCLLQNDFVRVQLRRDGRLASLFHLESQREAVATDAVGNNLLLFDDHPIYHDAWDVDIYHLEKYQAVAPAQSMKIVECGPLRVGVEFTYALSEHSHCKQTVYLTAINARLDFVCEVDWHEQHRFLKVEFPWNLRAMNATYEIQFGHLERPTHFNTSWDMARFEVCAHRWADLSEPDFGVALLNDCKYGYSTHGKAMRLSLLRAPKEPDPQADMGSHRFTYAVFPHSGSLLQAGVIDMAAQFNAPLLLRTTNQEVAEQSFFSISEEHVIIDTIKKAEDDNAIIVRIYEAHGRRGKATLCSSLSFAKAALCDLLERDQEPLAWQNGQVAVDVTPFSIVTVKLYL